MPALIGFVDLLARAIALALIVVAPWLLAGVEGSSQVWLIAAATLGAALVLVRILLDRSGSIRLPAGSAVLMVAICFGAVQTLPLGSVLARQLAPANMRLRDDLAAMQPSPDAALAKQFPSSAAQEATTVSFYPASTRHDLTLLALAAGMYLLGGVFFRTARARALLCWVTAINGTAIAFFGLVQKLSWNGKLFWQIKLEGGGQPFGPFIDRNHAGGFLTLCLAGAIGATMWSWQRSRDSSRLPHDEYPYPHDRRREFRDIAGRFLSQWNEVSLVAILLAAFIAAGILCSLSRGSVLSLIGATLLTAVLVARNRQNRAYLAVIALVAAFGLAVVVWVGMTGQLGDRLSTVIQRELVADGRVPNWRDGLKAAEDFWPSGSGLGTFRFIYRWYEDHPSKVWYIHAENLYLETLIETGVPGLLLLLLLIGISARAAWRLMRDENATSSQWFGTAGIFAITGQALHSVADFDLSIPANMMLLALFCGSLAASRAPRARSMTQVGGGFLRGLLRVAEWRWLPTVLTTVFLLALALAWRESWRQAAIESAIVDSRFADTPEALSATDLSAAIARMTSAMQHEADHALGQQHLAELWVQSYRLQALEIITKERPGYTPEQLWPATSLPWVRARARDLARGGSAHGQDDLRAAPAVSGNLLPAIEHAELARRGCQLVPTVELLLAQLTFLVDDPAADQGPLDRARRLAPGAADVLFTCGRLDLEAGRIDRGMRSWRSCLELYPERLSEIYPLARQVASGATIANELVPDQPEVLAEVAHFFLKENELEANQALAARISKFVTSAKIGEAQQHYLQALTYLLTSATDKSIDEYRQAVELDPRQDAWHYELALLLKQQGRLSEAYQQALLCNRLEPDNQEYSEFLKSVYPLSR
jgi:O-antigen ligase/tetratricopeptide (TPR) repeat protein